MSVRAYRNAIAYFSRLNNNELSSRPSSGTPRHARLDARVLGLVKSQHSDKINRRSVDFSDLDRSRLKIAFDRDSYILQSGPSEFQRRRGCRSAAFEDAVFRRYR